MVDIGNVYDKMAEDQNGVIDKSTEEKSFSSYESAHQIYKEIGSQQKTAEGLNEITEREANLLINVAEVYEHLGKPGYALTTLEEPIQIAEKYNWLDILGEALIARGFCHLALKRQKDAIASFDAALRAGQQSANPSIQARAQASIGEYYVAEKNDKEALVHFTEARDLFQQAGVKGRGAQLVEIRIRAITSAQNPSAR
jgi:tetratricopeptide (TPR) repeat protein